MDRDGTFAECFNLDGQKDAEPVRRILPTLTGMTKAWRRKAYLILCQSLYTYDQWKVKGLENLCTEENRWGREPRIDERLFHSIVTKSHNSITSMPASEWEELVRHTREHLILTGVTTTSCIKKTVEALRLGFWKVIIPRNAVASRASQKEEADLLLDSWSGDSASHVIVVPSWRDITFLPPPGGASLYS